MRPSQAAKAWHPSAPQTFASGSRLNIGRSRHMTRSTTTVLVLGLLLVAAGQAPAQWGHIKGQVVLDGEVPEREKIDTSKNKDDKFCQSRGRLLSDKLVVDGKSRGVRYAMAWLVDANNP